MSNGLDKLAEGVGKAIETVPDIYSDTLKPSMQEFGKTISLIPKAINAAFVPLRQWIVEREYNFAETEKLLAKKLENVEPEKIVTPEAYIAIPAIQAISYSMNSEELRNLYANLLAKSMNYDTKDLVHPAFVNIISQMTPLDAKVLQFLLNEPEKDMPVIDLIATRPISGGISYIILQTNLTPITFSNIDAISLSLENLFRNNLVYISENEYTNGYDSIYENKQYKEFVEKQKKIVPKMYPEVREVKKNCALSTLGKFFCNICIL